MSHFKENYLLEMSKVKQNQLPTMSKIWELETILYLVFQVSHFLYFHYSLLKGQKSNKRLVAITRETKRTPKERSKDRWPSQGRQKGSPKKGQKINNS